MRIAPVSSNDKTTFGVFKNPPEEVIKDVGLRLKNASAEERSKFVQRVKQIVDEHKNVKTEITQGIETLNSRPTYYAEFGGHHFVEPDPNDPPLTRIIKTMENAAKKAIDDADLEKNFKEYNQIWA